MIAQVAERHTISVANIIQMNDVWASYDGKNYSLKGVSLSIERGTNYAVIGASGSGKSTLVKLINGMMIPSRGAVRVDYDAPDTSSKKFKKRLNRIGYIPQNLGLVKNLTVLENVLIGALPRMGAMQSFFKSFPSEELYEAGKILDMVGLSEKSGRMTYMLSGGERRRVAIARALMQRPDILLADEIVSELDSVTAKGIMDLIADAQKKIGLTAIMVHHDMQLALEYANKVAVIREGEKILEIGVEGDKIVDFHTGNLTREEIMEMYSDEPEK